MVLVEDGSDSGKEIEGEEAFVSAAVWPASFEAELVAYLKPVSDLLDGRLLEVWGKWSLTGAGSGARGGRNRISN